MARATAALLLGYLLFLFVAVLVYVSNEAGPWALAWLAGIVVVSWAWRSR